MEYKLFDDYITLQSLLKELGIIQSGGAIKSFLANTTVLFNGEHETRRGKKLRVGDTLSIPETGLKIVIVRPNQEELQRHLEEKMEKKRVSDIVKAMNKDIKYSKDSKSNKTKTPQKPRFPGI